MLHRRPLFPAAFALAALSLAAFAQQNAAPASVPTGESLGPYYPTPDSIVDRMLQLGALKAGEKMFDLGSGDGRIVIMAAGKYHADATGVELDQNLVRQSSAKIKSLGLTGTARIIFGDVMKQNYSQANLITVYLLPKALPQIQAMLEGQLKKGTRVVAHDYEIGTWVPVKSETIPDEEGRAHKLFLYIR